MAVGLKDLVPGAVNIPRGLLELKAAADSPAADETPTARPEARIILHCAKAPSARSVLAAETLGRLGYLNVAVLEGGLNAWVEAGHPAESEASAVTS